MDNLHNRQFKLSGNGELGIWQLYLGSQIFEVPKKCLLAYLPALISESCSPHRQPERERKRCAVLFCFTKFYAQKTLFYTLRSRHQFFTQQVTFHQGASFMITLLCGEDNPLVKFSLPPRKNSLKRAFFDVEPVIIILVKTHSCHLWRYSITAFFNLLRKA